MNKKIKNSFLIFLFASLVQTNFIFSALDTTFGTGGIVTTSIGRTDVIYTVTTYLTTLAVNHIAVAGFTNTKAVIKFAVARYTTLGALDTTFNLGGIQTTSIGTMSECNSLALQSNSKITVGGLAYMNQTNFALARYTTLGALDTTFTSSGFVTTSSGAGASINSIQIQSDGKIVGGGSIVSGPSQFALARYNTNGSLDTGFGTAGIVLTQIGLQASIKQIAIQGDGKILAAGYVFDGAVNVFALARYNTDGTLDTGFGTGGIVTTVIGSDARAQALAIQTDGSIVVAGYIIQSNITQFAVARYTSNGGLDTTFNTTGIVITQLQYLDQAYALAIQSDGKIIAAGSSLGDSATQFALVRYTTAGALDLTFGTSGIELTTIGGASSISVINSLSIQNDGNIVAAGYTTTDNFATSDFALARYLP